MFDNQCQEKNLNLKVDIDKTIPTFIKADILRIKQIITNLLSNAIKFSKVGESVYFKVNYSLNQLHFSIIDEGIGIDKNSQKYIFQAFSQAQSSTTREFGGTGLGLAISQKLTKLLGGKLMLESKLNQGSEFSFAIPIEVISVQKI